MSGDRFQQFLRRVPKVELHVHLEGAIQPATLFELARRNRVDLPVTREEELGDWFRFRDFEHFVEVYLTCSKCLQQPEDFRLIARDFIREQARQRVVYSEAHFTIGTHLMNGGRGDEIRDALAEAVEEGEREHGVMVRWIPDIVRNVSWKWADRTTEWALDGRGHGVVALGLSGIEKGQPNDPFRAHFQAALDEGLHRTAHGGEHEGPSSIRSVLEVTQAERLGHGVRAVEDPALVAELADRGLPLEICPTSNVCLGVFEALEQHTFDELHRGGVQVTVSSDDPPLFGTSLTEELERVAATWGYDADTVGGFIRTAAEHAFLPPRERTALVEQIDTETAALREELGL